MKSPVKTGILLAVLAAALYALNAPASKILLDSVPATLMAGLLYVGAGLGMGVVALCRLWNGQRRTRRTTGAAEGIPGDGIVCTIEPADTDDGAAHAVQRTDATEPFVRSDLPYVLAMIALDVAAPILLLLGLSRTTAAGASLLNNFEIVATAVIALVVFKETISRRLWAGIGFVTVACALLSVETGTTLADLRPQTGSLLILGACLAWGIENNCTRRLSAKDPLIIVLLKGIFSGSTSVVIGLCLGERIEKIRPVFAVLCVGFVAYGLSIFCYVYAQRMLGAARTGAYYAIAPFIGTLLSLAVFRDPPPVTYYAALALMAVGVWLSSGDEPVGQILKRRFRRTCRPRRSTRSGDTDGADDR